MSEFLIKAIDATNDDPGKAARGCYKRGDVVAVMPDGHEWAPGELSKKGYIIKVPGLDHVEARKYIEPEIEWLDAITPIRARKSKYKIDIDSLTVITKKQLIRDRSITVNWADIKNIVIHKTLGITAA